MMTLTHVPSTSHTTSNGGRLVETAGMKLPLAAVSLDASAGGGIARVTLRQRFTNPHAVPLAVTYTFPLPESGAVSAYAFSVGSKRITGEVDKREAARERFEEAVLQGKTAALLDQERTSLFTQELGNVPPGAEIEVELVIDQRLTWMHEGAWEWRFPTAAAPRYLGGRVPDAERVTIDVADAPMPPRVSLVLRVGDAKGRVESPSHAVRVDTRERAQAVELSGPAPLDRDVVVRWSVGEAKVGLALRAARAAAKARTSEAAYGLLTIVPPALAARGASVPRDLIVLLDTSGSMGGEPLDQARNVVGALVDTLRDGDRLEMIEFSSDARRWKREAVQATEANRASARAWLGALRASGGTEMRTGILEALTPLRAESQRQVVVVTDGQIGFEHEVVRTILQTLPPSSRVHTVGVGSAVNRSLTGPAARAGRGTEIVIGLGEDAERAAKRIVAATAEALVVDLTVTGSAVLNHAPERLPDLFAGAPVLVGVKLRPEGGEVVVRGRTRDGAWEARLEAPACACGEGEAAPIALFARESVEDLEARFAAERGNAEAIDRAIERFGVDFQIATRLTSWVAVTEEATVDPESPTKRVRMPQELPYGMAMEGLGLRGAGVMLPSAIGGMLAGAAPMASAPAPMRTRAMLFTPPAPAAAPPPPAPQAPAGKASGGGAIERLKKMFTPKPEAEKLREASAPAAPGARAAVLVLRARVTLRKRDTLAFAIDAETAFAWPEATELTLVWGDGTRTRARVTRGARGAHVKSGETLTVALQLDATDAARSEAPARIVFDGGEILLTGA